MKKNVKVSAIVSTYNSEKYIKGRIDNLLEQTIMPDLEIVIVNSGSMQNEDSIIKSYLPHPSIKYIFTEQRETIYKAWNRGIRISTGEYITNANTDDRLRKDALEKLSGVLDKNRDFSYVYADQYITESPAIDFESAVINGKINWPDYRKELLFVTHIGGPQPMWRSSLHFKDNIWFDESYEVAGDYKFVCDISRKYPLLHVPDYLGVYYRDKNKSNKEFQDFDRTFNETYDIRYNFIVEYLNSMSEEEIREMVRFYKRWVDSSRFVHKLASRIAKFLYPKRPLVSAEAEYWFLSILYERLGDKDSAIKICNNYLSKKKSLFLLRQVQHLNENKDKHFIQSE